MNRRMLTLRVVPALAGLTIAASVAGAQQRDSSGGGRDRAGTTFEVAVERLSRELVRKRQITAALTRSMQSLQIALRNDNVQQLQRAQYMARLDGVREQLASVEADGIRLRRQLSELCPDEVKPAGWVGVAYGGDITYSREGSGPVITRFLDLPSVTTVEPGSPAERAGIQTGDFILSIAGNDIRERAIAISPLLKPGKKIAFRVRRGNEDKLLMVTVERRPDDYETQCGGWIDESIAAAFAPSPIQIVIDSRESGGRLLPPPAPAPVVARVPGTVSVAPVPAVAPVPPTPPTPLTPALAPFGIYSASAVVTFAGAQIAPMDNDLAEALGAKRGVLVLRSGRGTPAERSGLRGGDVVVSVDGRAVNSPIDFLRAMERAEAGRSVKLSLVRKRKGMSMEFEW
ncbi:MAG: PDZ domain-containing protein [Gemmatimonadaceae bacterium]